MLRNIPIAATAAFMVLSRLTSAQGPPFIGNLLIQPGLSAAKCITAASNTDGAAVTIQDCTGSDSQSWLFNNGQVLVFRDKCLDVPNGANVDGTKLRIYKCSVHTNPHQQWIFTWWDNHLTWADHSKCLDLAGADLTDGNPIQISHCTYNSPSQVWDVGYMANNLPYNSQNGQTGYNLCGSGWNETSLCQTAWFNAVDDFCLWAPPQPNQAIGDSEQEEVAWCLKPHGTRAIPNGVLHGVHFVKTPSYIQVTGVGDFSSMNIAKGDEGGELDDRGANGSGNPIGGLLYTDIFGNALQLHEWTSFMGNYASDSTFCFRACVGDQATELCNHIYDVMGCEWNMPANYEAGTFESCEGDDDLPMGVYGTSTFHQGDPTTPPAHPVASSSNCKTYPTIGSVPANSKRGHGGFEHKHVHASIITPTPHPK